MWMSSIGCLHRGQMRVMLVAMLLFLLVVVDVGVDAEPVPVAFHPAWGVDRVGGLAAGESLCVSGGVSGCVFLVQNGCPFIWGGVQSVMVSMVSIGVMMSAWIFPVSHVR